MKKMFVICCTLVLFVTVSFAVAKPALDNLFSVDRRLGVVKGLVGNKERKFTDTSSDTETNLSAATIKANLLKANSPNSEEYRDAELDRVALETQLFYERQLADICGQAEKKLQTTVLLKGTPLQRDIKFVKDYCYKQ